jgi:ureidoacrylate peracid hydrolase
MAPGNCALIVVDMQNIWAHPRGSRYLPSSEEIVPKIRALREFCHANKVPVIYLYTTKRKDLADVGLFADLKPETHDAENEWNNFEGTIGAEIVEVLKPGPDDILVKKFRYSGFYGTQLENLLRALGRDTVAITGVATNVCCDSTARDGAMRDFKVVLLSDCNASFTAEEQEATLKNFAKHFGVVMDANAFKSRLLNSS